MKDAAERHSRIYKLEDTGYDPEVHFANEGDLDEKLSQALIRSLDWGEKIPIGVFYKNEYISSFTTRMQDHIPNYSENPPFRQRISENGKPTTDVSRLLDSLLV